MCSRRARGGNDPRIPQRQSDDGGEGVSRNAREWSLETAEKKVVFDAFQRASPKKVFNGRHRIAQSIVVDEHVDDDRGPRRF